MITKLQQLLYRLLWRSTREYVVVYRDEQDRQGEIDYTVRFVWEEDESLGLEGMTEIRVGRMVARPFGAIERIDMKLGPVRIPMWGTWRGRTL